MKSLEKIWTIVYKINQAREITPKGKPCRISIDTITPKISQQDADYIFEKLEEDEKVIKIISIPVKAMPNPKLGEDAYNYVFEVLPSFEKYRDELYAQYSFGVDSLNDFNFLKIYDVVLDIKEELELTDGNKIRIRLFPSVIKFGQLLPADSISLRDQYCDYRWKSVEFLKKLKVIDDFRFINLGHRWESEIEITVNRLEFGRLVEKLEERFKKIQSTPKANQIETPETKLIRYDSHNHTLYIGDAEIVFKKEDSNQAELCKVLFRDKKSASKIWHTDEILEAWGWTKELIYDKEGKLLKSNRLKAYQSADKLNNKVMKATQGKISDLLVYTTKTVTVNSKYREMLANN